MKKIFLILLVGILLMGFVCAVEIPQQVTDVKNQALDTGKSAIQDISNNQIIQTIESNYYVGIISNFLFGVELDFSWIFCFAVLLWIILLVIVMNAVKVIVRINSFFALLIAAVIATIAMRSFGGNVASWVGSITTSWVAAIGAIITGIIFMVVYTIIMKLLGKSVTKDRIFEAEKTGKIIRTQKEIAEEEFKDMEE
jgi:hypothetical protein